jgi:hypothetical protein
MAEGAIHIFVDGEAGPLDVVALARRLEETLGRKTVVMGEVVAALAGRPQTEVRQMVAAAANAMAWARVRDTSRQEYRVLPLRSEVDQEEARLRGRSQPAYEGVSHPKGGYSSFYDAAALQEAYRGLLGDEPAIVLTDRRLASWSSAEWSEISVVAGNPTLLSVPDVALRQIDTLASKLASAFGAWRAKGSTE